MYSSKLGRLLLITTCGIYAAEAHANTYLCTDNAKVSLNQFGVSSSLEETADFEPQNWVVDTARGWRRLDLPDFRGTCESTNGYIVCRTDGIAFGEATLSIHPDGSNFVLVYTDYGLGALAFVGKCKKA